MDTKKDTPTLSLVEVEPFTGEPDTFPVPPQTAPVPLLRSPAPFQTAMTVQRPRNLDKVVAAVLREAEFAGDAFYYSFRLGGKHIEGPSIGLALAVAREWSNCAVPVEYSETPTEWVFTAHFIDLERGFTVSRVLRKKKGKGAFRKVEGDRAEDMTFQAAQSRAIRNVVLAGVPRWLTDQAKERAKDTVLQGISKEGLAVATEKALKVLAGYGISEARVLAVLGKPRQEWVSEDIASLRGLASQLRDGQATAAQLFPPVEPQPEPRAPSHKRKQGQPAPGKKSPAQAPPGSSVPPAARPAQVERILGRCLEKGIDLAVILEQWQVSQLEDLEEHQVHQVQEWLQSQ